MSAKLLKGGLPTGTAYSPFSIPASGLSFENHSAGNADKNAIAAIIERAEKQAEAIIEAGKAEALRLVHEAHERAAQIESEAQERGLIEARAQVDEELQLAVTDLREQLQRSLTEVEQLYPMIATRAEHDLVKLALEIARKVVHREVATDPDITVTLARVALERLHPRAIATIRLNPDDYAYVSSHREKLSPGCAIEIISDVSIGRGGCLVQSEHGDIDARIDHQFATIERGFFQG